MSVVRPPNNVECFDAIGLSAQECDIVRDEAYRLMAAGRSLGIGEEDLDDQAKIVFVLDGLGNRYTIVRNVGAYLLLDPALGVIAVRRGLVDIIEALRGNL